MIEALTTGVFPSAAVRAAAAGTAALAAWQIVGLLVFIVAQDGLGWELGW